MEHFVLHACIKEIQLVLTTHIHILIHMHTHMRFYKTMIKCDITVRVSDLPECNKWVDMDYADT